MITPHQIKKEIFTLIRKGFYEPAAGDVVNVAALKKILWEKYADELSDEAFSEAGDELADAGDFYWNDDGKLALSPGGLAFLQKTR
ncbi:MAG: hypothetical protein EOP06_30025 [Proteobacteria bacterium]|nr:MAG: hypothetical protein EOP06_30025 [Pseudomonadota bacterium]